MAVFVIANVKVTDDSRIPDYATNVHDIVHKHGGKYLARGADITTDGRISLIQSSAFAST